MFGSNKITRMSRRRFVEVATAMGVSATSLQYGTQEGLARAASGHEVPYVAYLRNEKNPDRKPGEMPEREPIYKSIPRDEWAVRWTADNLRNRVAKTIERTWPDQPISSAFGAMDQSPTGFGVEVHYLTRVDSEGNVHRPDPSIEEVREKIPNKGVGTAGQGEFEAQLKDIPIVVMKKQQVNSECTETADGMSEHEWDPVPGGIPVNYTGDTDVVGSVCAKFIDNDYGECLVGSGHAADLDEEVKMGTATGGKDVLGHVRKKHADSVDIDYSVIEDDSDESFKDHLAEVGEPGSLDEQTVGIVTDSTMKADVDSNATYYSQGGASGRLRGQLIKVGGALNTTSYVTSTHDNEDGDSGGILFKKKDSNEVYVAAVIEWQINDGEDSDNCGDDLKGTTAETVENKAGGKFD